MSLLEIAKSIAIEAHRGQKYGDGRDYIEAHVAPIAGAIARMGYGPDYQATGWLHDVLEDSKQNGREITEWDLRDRGVEEHLVIAASLLTKNDQIPHGLYLAKISHNKHATVGKFVDSNVNLANTILHPDDRYNERLFEYLGNVTFLQQFLPKPDMPVLNPGPMLEIS